MTSPEALQPETSLSSAQRRQMVARTLFNAQLLLDGAEFHRSGVLLITRQQWDNAAETGSPFVSSAEQQEREARAQWLTTPIRDIFEAGGVSKEQAGRMFVALRPKGLSRISHLLAYGRTSTSNVNGIGPNAMGALRAFVGANPHGIEWRENPTMEDIASVCPALSDVPRACLETNGFSHSPKVRVRLPGTMEALLAEGAIESDVWVARGVTQEDIVAEIATIRSAVQGFASDFALAQQRVEYPDLVNRPQM